MSAGTYTVMCKDSCGLAEALGPQHPWGFTSLRPAWMSLAGTQPGFQVGLGGCSCPLDPTVWRGHLALPTQQPRGWLCSIIFLAPSVGGGEQNEGAVAPSTVCSAEGQGQPCCQGAQLLLLFSEQLSLVPLVSSGSQASLTLLHCTLSASPASLSLCVCMCVYEHSPIRQGQ